ncbi:polysaccharide biosynthesis/export family protein [Marimonas arenosa]|uniref:Polysaccharide export protein n=1 Tax=Marimonas arenosa TaxID=1795305 RepID=A0AAE3WDH0_9RHOB|nr:polysaccharide biosynthesis/export family protein [Marimonas arenosa]MDQ2089665.1 polysaccharide export protein [Marimonas arenosa]
MPRHLMRVISALVLTMVFVVTSAPSSTAQDGYRIRPGDTLRIEVLEDSALNRDALVLPDGTISFPLAGTLRASGRTVSDLQGAIATGLASNFAAAPNVFVSVNTLAERKPVRSRRAAPPVVAAYVMGEIAKPGKLEVSPGTTILQLLAEAGGLTKFAAQKRIELRRTDPATGAVTTYLFSYTGQSNKPRIPGSTVLQSGDVVVVPERRLFE